MLRQIRCYLCISVIVACAAGSMAQPQVPAGWNNPRHFDPFYLGTRVTLGPDWLFSAGDNPIYASPAYDDSGWGTVSAGRTLASYGIGNIRYGWYRIHVHFLRTPHYLAIETQYTSGGYELYANGVRVGANGQMNGALESSQNYLTSYDIPDSMIDADGNLVIAIRFALNRAGREFGANPPSPFTAGGINLATRDAALSDASYQASHQVTIPLMLCGLNLVVGLVALALFLAMRSRLEYLAIAVSLLAAGLQMGGIAWSYLHTTTAATSLFETLWLGITNVALIEFVRLILHMRLSRWLLVLEIANFLGYFAMDLSNAGYLALAPTMTAYFLPALIVKAVLCVLLLQGLLRGNRDARVILPAIAVISIANYWYFFSVAGSLGPGRLHIPEFHIPELPGLQIGTYNMDFWSTWSVIYCVTMLLFLVLRTIGIARERARVAAELEAARAVQHVLIPEEIPTVPGFALQSVYKPAGEVSGDFFQILPTANQGVLVVIGDVSGKGMPAAMTVSLLVGTFRTLAHYTQSPSEILAAMNTRMLARSNNGFTTCLVLRVDANGSMTVANAGHIAPYLAGKELPLENGLPLGLAATANYVECTFHCAPGEQITLITDGVVEARDKTGALFGFERTAGISTQSANQIVRAAELFGQQDDMTALTLIASAAPEPALA